MDTPIAKTRTLRENFVTAASVQHPARTYYADGTRVVRRGKEALRSTLGTTAGMTVDAVPYDYQVVKWDDGNTTHTAPQALALVRSVDAPEGPTCRKIAGAACGHMSTRVWAVQWTTKGLKDRRTRYVHDVENRLTGERESTLYPEGSDQYAALYPHFELSDGWRKEAKASA